MTQNEALEILKSGHNVYLTGAAGTGKTYLLNEYIQFLKAKKVSVGVTASTGIAATHLGGLTIHAWAGIGVERFASDADIKVMAGNRRVAKRFAKTEVLIIDEISMIDADRLNLVERVARTAKGSWDPFGGIQVVLCGDFFQLPPVAKYGEPLPRFAYHSSAWKELDLQTCYLHEQHRHGDQRFFNILSAIRQAEVNDFVVSGLRAQRETKLANSEIAKLYSHNVDVDAENKRELNRLSGEETHYNMATSGVPAIVKSLKNGCLAPEVLTVKRGAKVMFVKNNFEKGYVNGTLGKVVGFDRWGYPLIKTFNNREISASPEAWNIEENGKVLAKISQVPLRLAWAITIHKSQGMTLDAVEIDLANAFEKGMGYVALSRARSLDGIKLTGFNKTALQVHPEVLAYDKELQRYSEETRQKFYSTPRKHKKFKTKGGTKTYSVDKIRKSHPKAYKRWSIEEERVLIDEFSRGEKIKVIAVNLGRKIGAVRARLRKLGLIKN